MRGVINVQEPKTVVKRVTFDGGAGTGAVGTVALFTIAGISNMQVVVDCDTSLTEAAGTATIEIGMSGATNIINAQINAVDLEAGEIWVGGNAPAVAAGEADKGYFKKDEDIFMTVGAQNVDGGVIDVYITYIPLSSGAKIIAA